jgi:hypothetical protein
VLGSPAARMTMGDQKQQPRQDHGSGEEEEESDISVASSPRFKRVKFGGVQIEQMTPALSTMDNSESDVSINSVRYTNLLSFFLSFFSFFFFFFFSSSSSPDIQK